MTSDEAREAFDDAFEGELAPDVRAAFDAALATDAALAAEWDEFVGTLRMVRGLGLDADPHADPDAPDHGPRRHVPLLAGVQSKLRVRSRGRFYRDRFASVRREELALPIILALVALLLVAVAWAGHRVVDVAPAPHSGPRSP